MLTFESHDGKMLTTVVIVVVLSLRIGASCALITEQDDTCLNSYSWSARGVSNFTSFYHHTSAFYGSSHRLIRIDTLSNLYFNVTWVTL